MVKPTLLVLAAGMGSRYGSLKQMDGVGPGNEAIIDYSVYDAIRAGFGKVVFVIRHSFASEFEELFTEERFGHRIRVEYVYQELDSLPEGFSVPEGRVKPWGTNHAILVARNAIREPFAVINADDFYGAEAFRVIGDYLTTLKGGFGRYCMVAYELSKTLSENGTVSRGICTVDGDGNLTGMVERTQIERVGDRIVNHGEEGDLTLAPDAPVSMNLFGFTPDYFIHSDQFFRSFLRTRGNDPKAECYIPSMVNKLIEEHIATVKVLRSPAQWFGVTYKEDKPLLVHSIERMIDAGEYPRYLWK